MKSSHALISVCCIIFFLTGCSDSHPKTGSVAKDFRLDTLKHDRFYLNQQKGKTVVLLFWTTWCNICKQEMVELNSLKNTSNNDSLIVAAVCADPENSNDVKRIVEELKLDYPILLDKNAKVSAEYKISGFPTTIVIDRKGVVSLVRKGYNSVTMQHITARVNSLIASGTGVK